MKPTLLVLPLMLAILAAPAATARAQAADSANEHRFWIYVNAGIGTNGKGLTALAGANYARGTLIWSARAVCVGVGLKSEDWPALAALELALLCGTGTLGADPMVTASVGLAYVESLPGMSEARRTIGMAVETRANILFSRRPQAVGISAALIGNINTVHPFAALMIGFALDSE